MKSSIQYYLDYINSCKFMHTVFDPAHTLLCCIGCGLSRTPIGIAHLGHYIVQERECEWAAKLPIRQEQELFCIGSGLF